MNINAFTNENKKNILLIYITITTSQYQYMTQIHKYTNIQKHHLYNLHKLAYIWMYCMIRACIYDTPYF